MDRADYIRVGLLGVLILLPSLFTGGRGEFAVFLFFILLAVYVFLSRQNLTRLPVLHPFWLLCLWLLWIVVNTIFFSHVPYLSIKGLLPLTGGALLFYASLSALRSEANRKLFAMALVGGALILVFIGFVFFLGSENYGYLRFISTFYHHNAFAGFLILPIVLGIWLLFEEKRFGYILTFAAALFLFTAFILTFSRGGYISLGAALLVFLIVLYRASHTVKQFLLRLFITVLLIALGASAAYGLFISKGVQSREAGSGAVSAPHAAENKSKGETGFGSRLYYMRYAFELFTERPFIGYGLQSYASESRRVQDDVRFYSVDPHNLYLRFLAELGVLGGILFFAFAAWIVISAGFYVLKNKKDILYGAVLAGFVGVLLHNGGDFDFQFPANVYLFFTAAAFLYAPVLPNAGNGRARKVWFLVTLTVTVVAAVLAGLLWLGSYYFARGAAALREGRRQESIESIERSLRYDFLNPFARMYLSDILLQRGDDEERVALLLNEAGKIHPFERRIKLYKAKRLILSGDLPGAVVLLKEAIALAPYKDLDPVVDLAGIYLDQGRIEDARVLVVEALGRFPDSAINSPFWADPRKDKVREQIAILKRVIDE